MFVTMFMIGFGICVFLYHVEWPKKIGNCQLIVFIGWLWEKSCFNLQFLIFSGFSKVFAFFVSTSGRSSVGASKIL